MRVQGGVIDAGGRTGDLAVVGGGIEVDYVQAVFEQVDAGDEGFALDAVLVELVRVPVGCCYQDHAVGHKCF